MAAEFPQAESTSGLQLGPARQRNLGDIEGRQQQVDPVTLGFAQLNARFDKMDRRVDNLERRPTPQAENHETDWDEADHAWEEYRGNGRCGREEYDRPYRHQGRARGRPYRGGRGDRFGEGVLPGRGSRPGQRRGETGHRMGRRRDNWDLPQRHEDWDDEGYEERGVTCWDPPQNRERLPRQGSNYSSDVKMDAPHFNGADAPNWISRVQYYFDHKQVPEAERLHYVVMLFDPPASEWIFNYRETNGFVTWPDFLDDVRHRFDPQSFRNYTGLIAKLVQTTTVADYHATFEKYLNRVTDLSESALIPIFIQGLKQPLQEKVELQNPESLAEAMALALRLAATHEERPQHTSSYQRRPWPGKDQRATPAPVSNQAAVPHPQDSLVREADKSRVFPVRVSNAEKSERARRGLCYHCPEKWVAGHVCKVKLLCYMDDEVDDPLEVGAGEQVPEEELITADLSHLHALDGRGSSKPFIVQGTLGDTTVRVLIDTGATLDFLHPRIAERLQLELTPIRPFRVLVGNGASLLCTHISRGTKLTLQGSVFVVDLHILAHHGPDVILGMNWLESLGKVSADFVRKTLEFTQGDRTVFLQGLMPGPKQISLHSLYTLTAQPADHEFYEIVPIDSSSETVHTEGLEGFPPDLPAEVLEVLTAHRAVFEQPRGIPPTRLFDHRIHLLPGTRPINVRPYRYPYFQKTEIEKQVRDMLDQGIIRHSHSPFSSPVLLIRKKDGTFRFCIDYRALNKATVPDHFPIPTAEELFDELGSAKYFTKLDLRSGYHQIRMSEDDIFKTAFRTHDGHFEFLVMPFGLTNAPSTFQAAMNSIFQPLLRKCVIVFFDDILIYSPSLELHGRHLEEVLQLLHANNFFVKLSKCSFCSVSVEYLGHIIDDGKLKADPAKIEAMTSWPIPRTVKQLRGFLGLTGYYRRFIAHYATIAAPLTDLLKKEAFRWSTEAETAFASLKSAMTSAPVLQLPNFSLPFCVETDACEVGIGAVLMQLDHPIAFFSKKLGPRRRVASTYQKELYAIVEAVQKWRQYLLGREFIIRTDQRSLKELLQQVVQTPDQQLYVRKLMGYKFVIEYKRGVTNKAADALSRQHDTLGVQNEGTPTETPPSADTAPVADVQLLVALARPVPDVMRELQEETASLPDLVELTAKIKAGDAPPHLSWADGLIYYHRRVLVSAESKTRRTLLREHHCSPTAGHPGHERTFRLLAAGFYWPKMRKEVVAFVNECVVCQATKYSTRKPAGLLQPLPVPSQVWEDVSMDFITGLPQSRGYTVIMVVVDRLSKYAHFAPLPTKFDALRVAQLFVNTVVRHHGFPKTLVSDRDSVFLNATWEEMLRLSGTKLHFSTAYHPQSDGQTEVRNRGLEQYLRAFASDKPSKWTNFLPWAELALNCFHHSALGTSPYRALYGREPPTLVASPPSAKTPPNVAEIIKQRGELLVTLRRNLLRAQQRMAVVANRHRRHVEFEVGDVVWLKLQPYRQHSVAKPLSAKLAPRFYGPFEVLERVGPVAYKLRLPDGSRVHNVFHVSLLREFVAGDGDVDGVKLPPEFVGDRPVVRPVAVLEERVSWRDGRPEKQCLVQWEDDASTPTWEPVEAIGRQFPDVRLVDKALLNGGGVDTGPPITTAATGQLAEPEPAVEQHESAPPEPTQKDSSRGEELSTSKRSLRPRDKLRPPSKFKN